MRSTRLARRATALAAALVGALTVVVVPAASAQAADACTARTTTQAFAAFGDTNNYFSIGGGTFESADLSFFAVTGGPTVVGENEPWRVLGSTHARSVALPAGASLTAIFCVQVGEDAMRLFAKAPGVSSSSLAVKTTVSTAYGSALTSTTMGGAARAWAPSPRIPLVNVSGPDGRQYVTLTITNTGAGTWLVDDILVDPWKTL